MGRNGLVAPILDPGFIGMHCECLEEFFIRLFPVQDFPGPFGLFSGTGER